VHEIHSKPTAHVDFGEVSHIKGFEVILAKYPDYLCDESKLKASRVDYLIFPENEDELAAAVRTMVRRHQSVTVAGARTGLVGGCVPGKGALVSLEKMDQVLDIYYLASADEWRIRTQAGVLLSQLDTIAKAKVCPQLEHHEDPMIADRFKQFKTDPVSYFYPPDPTETSASIGGTVATNASGARTYRYGPTRDWVRGIRVMTMKGEYLDIPRGKYFSSPGGTFTLYDSEGGHTVIQTGDYPLPHTKNTCGFFTSPHVDLVDLFIGSEGAFGIITSVEVALLPSEHKCSIIQFTPSDKIAIDLVKALRENRHLKLDFMEFYSENALNLLRQMQAEDPRKVAMAPIPDTAGAALFFDLAFDPDASDQNYQHLESTVKGVGADLKESWAGYEAKELSRFKHFRHLLPEKVSQVIAECKKQHPGIHRLSSDLAVPDRYLHDIWNLYKDRLGNAGINWVGFGHVGNNHFHISSMPRDMDELARGIDIYREFAETAVSYGGTVSAEHGVGKIKAKFLNIMYTPDQIQQMKNMKEAFDPDGLLNPGNIFTMEQ
jgi:D-lactate dehydrogenase (cytochrome)